MSETLTQFGTSFQAKIIASLLSNIKFIQTISDILSPSMFDSDSNKWLVKNVQDYYFKYKKMYEYLLDNNFRINIKDFMIEDLSDNNWYSYWDEVKQKCIDYRHE